MRAHCPHGPGEPVTGHLPCMVGLRTPSGDLSLHSAGGAFPRLTVRGASLSRVLSPPLSADSQKEAPRARGHRADELCPLHQLGTCGDLLWILGVTGLPRAAWGDGRGRVGSSLRSGGGGRRKRMGKQSRGGGAAQAREGQLLLPSDQRTPSALAPGVAGGPG